MFLAILMVSMTFSSSLAVSCSEEIENKSNALTIIDKYTNNEVLKQRLEKTVSSDLDLLKKVNLYGDVEIFDVNNKGDVVYKYEINEEITDYINVSENDGGDIVLNVREGELENELIYKGDGRIILDGHEVEILYDNQELSKDTAIAVPMRAGGRVSTYPMTLPLNSSKTDQVIPTNFKHVPSSDYTSPTLTLGSTLGSIAVSVLISVVVAAVSGGLAAVIAGVTSAVVGGLVSQAYSLVDERILILKSTYPNEKYVRFTSRTYAKNGNDSIYSEWIYSFALYGNSACRGVPAFAAAKKILQTT